MSQPRERAVPCAYCQRPTWNVSAVCDSTGCTERHLAETRKRDDFRAGEAA